MPRDITRTKTLTMPDMSDRYPFSIPAGNPPDGYVITFDAADGYYLALPPNKLLVIAATATTPYDIQNEDVILISHAGAAAVNLPPSPLTGTSVYIKDASGNAASFNITVNAPGLIDGSPSYTISTNYGCIRTTFAGSTWVILTKF